VYKARSFCNQPVHRFCEASERQAMAGAIAAVEAQLGAFYPLVIGTARLPTETTIPSLNPAAPDCCVGMVAAAGGKEVERAVAVAKAAFPSWAGCPVAERAGLMRRVATLLCDQRDAFAAWEVLEAGKPWREADADVCEAIDYLNYYADMAEAIGVGQQFNVAGESNRYLYLPRGVAVVIPPWNFPLAILVGMLAASLVSGNTAVLKPSSQTPVIAARFMDLLLQAGIPPGVVNYLPARGDMIGDRLVSHADVRIIAFTGSTEVGLGIHRLAAEVAGTQGYVKRVIAEMGGKNAMIVDDDADLDDAVAGVISSAFGYAGQKCSACSRLITVGGVHDRLLSRLIEACKSLVVGDPKAPQTVVGPVISSAAQQRILATIERGKASAHLAVQVEVAHPSGGYFVGPTIFTDVAADDVLARQEIFGPVLSVMQADDFEQALQLANDSRYALTGGVYSRSPAHLDMARREFDVGNLYLNRKITGAVVGRQPFGGFRMSGFGFKAGTPEYLLQFMQARTVTENLLRRGFAPDEGLDDAV